MATVEVPQTLEYRGGQLNAAAVLEVENFSNWKKRFMCHIIGIEPQFENIIKNGHFVPMTAGQRKPENQWKIMMIEKLSTTDYDSADESSVCSIPLPILKKLDGAKPISRPKTIKSILRSNSTFKAEPLKDVIINEPSSAPAKGNKSSSFSKVHSAPTVYLHNHKDHLGKFDEKADDGYLLGYSLVSKAFRVFNTRRQQTEETYHIIFDESPKAIKFLNPRLTTSTLLNQKDIHLMNIFILMNLLKDQNDQPVQNDEILNNDHSEHSNHTNDEQIIDSLPNTEYIQIYKHLSSLNTEDTSAQNTTISSPPIPVPPMDFRNKKDETRIVIKNKSRLVAQGYNQQDGIDCDETFTPVVRLEAIRIFLAFSTYMNFIVYQMDVKSAFLNGKLKEVVDVKPPPGFKSNEFPNHVCKLDKALYGLKQAPRAWYETLLTFLTEHKFVRGKIDNTLFVYKTQSDVILENPKESHLIAVNRIFKYLKGTSSLGLWYLKCLDFDLKGYSGSDYAGCNMDRKSTAAKAEYVAVAGCCANILWLKSQLTDYDIKYEKVPVFCDNTSAIAISNNPVLHSRTKHIDIRYQFIRDHILKGNIELHFIPTQYQLVDIFTKPLDEPTFKRLIVKLEELVTLDKPQSPNSFLPATQVDFTFDEIAFTTNNEVALIYPSHLNQEYFMVVSDFISKCCLKEAFTRAPTQYKEYLSEFWYTTKTLDNSKDWVSAPTGEVKGEIGKKPGATTGLRSKRSLKHTSDPKTKASKSQTDQSKIETQSSLAKDKSPSHPSPPTHVVGEMHKEAQQAAGGPTSLGPPVKKEPILSSILIPQLKLILDHLLLMILVRYT
uniref:Retrovirus-related Pol polyprotein from transposon TNT 1-94 n=1 Tax=Tanacetum cinerariifolium TaxID=118510 RepID=A0A699HPJ8_TANCI|nr:retrovirus-related Pol polyprotein from transposon TNT 1-94 [Tanacetum cinerariifolium]